MFKKVFREASDLFVDYGRFLIYPDFEKSKLTFGRFLACLAMFLLTLIGTSVFLSVLYYYFPSVEGSYVLQQGDPLLLTTDFVLVAVILGPIIEEMYFRSWMSKNKYFTMFLVVGAIDFCLTSFTTDILKNIEFSSVADSLIEFTNLLISIIFSLILLGNTKNMFAEIVWMRRRELFYTSCVFFALMHISNFDEETPKAIAIIAQTPLFASAALYGYFRVRFGLIFCIIFHILANSIVIFAYS